MKESGAINRTSPSSIIPASSANGIEGDREQTGFDRRWDSVLISRNRDAAMPHDPSAPGPRDQETGERASTILETDEDLRQALLANSKTKPPGLGVPSRTMGEGPAMTGGESPGSLYRPTARPPIAMLTVYDDGK